MRLTGSLALGEERSTSEMAGTERPSIFNIVRSFDVSGIARTHA